LLTKEIKIGKIRIGKRNPLVLISGPCVIESETSALLSAKKLKEITTRLNIPFIYKSSYDKANRTSIDSYRGPGLKEGLRILKRIKEELGIAVLSDVHCRQEVEEAEKVLDVIQIPAYLARQTDLILEAAKTKKVINIKKAQFFAPWDVKHVIRKIESVGNRNILITERGVCFGYNNLVSDFRSLAILREFGYPIIYDATHSVQIPGGKGKTSGGERKFVSPLARAAVAFGCDGLFIEVHRNPDKALSDGPNMIDFGTLENLLMEIKKIREVLCP
jgi:2-dehydro-3-deoxyphosphooctonate aldolase (KDO 8-P synthase)